MKWSEKSKKRLKQSREAFNKAKFYFIVEMWGLGKEKRRSKYKGGVEKTFPGRGKKIEMTNYFHL